MHCSCTALNPFYAGWHPPSLAWSSWASARTCCWQTPPCPQLPGKTKLPIRSLSTASLSDTGRWAVFEDWYHFQMIHSVNSGTWLSWQALTSTVAQSKFPLVVLKSIWWIIPWFRMTYHQLPLLIRESIWLITQNLESIQRWITPCIRMTDKGIFTVAKLCKRLKTANITNCSFTKKMTSYLKVKRGLRSSFKTKLYRKQYIAGWGVSFSTQLIGAGRVQGHQARNIGVTFFNILVIRPTSRNDSCHGPKSGRSNESCLPTVSQSTQTHIATGPFWLFSK